MEKLINSHEIYFQIRTGITIELSQSEYLDLLVNGYHKPINNTGLNLGIPKVINSLEDIQEVKMITVATIYKK